MILISKERIETLIKNNWIFRKSSFEYNEWLLYYRTSSYELSYYLTPLYTEYRIIDCYKQRFIFGQSAFLDRKHHCSYGPAIKSYNFYDNSKSEDWFIDGMELTTEVKQWMNKHNITRPLSKADRVLLKLQFG